MAWTFTEVATGKTGDGSFTLPTSVEAVNIELSAVPDWYGRTGLDGRPVYYGVGYVSVGQSNGPHWARVPIQMNNQIIGAPLHSVNRVIYWLPPGVAIDIWTGVWS